MEGNIMSRPGTDIFTGIFTGTNSSLGTVVNLAARGAVAAVVAAALAVGGASALAGHSTTVDRDGYLSVRLASDSTLLAANTDNNDARSHRSGPSPQELVNAGIAAKEAREKANAAATATGTARGVLDDKRAELSVAQRDAQVAQGAVDSQQAVYNSADQALKEAHDAKIKAAQATNADPNDPVKEAEFNIRNQTELDRLRDVFDAARKLEEVKKNRDSANSAVETKAVGMRQAETGLSSAQADQSALDDSATKAEKRYHDLSKDYDRNKKNGKGKDDRQQVAAPVSDSSAR